MSSPYGRLPPNCPAHGLPTVSVSIKNVHWPISPFTQTLHGLPLPCPQSPVPACSPLLPLSASVPTQPLGGAWTHPVSPPSGSLHRLLALGHPTGLRLASPMLPSSLAEMALHQERTSLTLKTAAPWPESPPPLDTLNASPPLHPPAPARTLGEAGTPVCPLLSRIRSPGTHWKHQ